MSSARKFRDEMDAREEGLIRPLPSHLVCRHEENGPAVMLDVALGCVCVGRGGACSSHLQ